ncbi:transient receptor potential cation channel subfamily A member 1 homolog [Montipora foliosa]|uniref:transient receptor potential cation channel subfamily A member 1 homolog n=1 Tax=Montipora foliosa TaxID=591990 RepID=UPI0035F1C284
MSYTFVGDVYDRSTPIEMTQVNPEPSLPAKPTLDELQVLDIEELSHISLHQAARDGRTDLMRQKILKLEKKSKAKLKKAINKGDEGDITPLHYAVRYGHADVVKLLADYGADVSKPGEDGASPLHFAARFRANTAFPSASRDSLALDGVDSEVNAVVAPLTMALSAESVAQGDANHSYGMQIPTEESSESLIVYLVEQGSDVNVRDNYGMTPLHHAASKGNLTAVIELLQCKEIKVDELDASGSTPLHCAATEGVAEVVKALLDAGADVRAKDSEKMTPIHFACSDGKIDTVKVLLQHVENSPCGFDVTEMLDDRNREGETALHAAVEGGYLDVVQLCLQKGAKVRDRRGNLAHPLHIAAINGHVEIAKCLTEHNAKIEARNIYHETPLHKAAAYNKTRMVSFLLEKGADIECLDKDNNTPLLNAVRSGHSEVVKLLLTRGANLKAKNTQDKTAFLLAAEENRINTLKEILQHQDAKQLVDESDLNENTPLHIAAMNGHALIVEALLKTGARIDSRNEDENTPLHLAAKNGKVRTIAELLKGDPSIINDENEASNTPLHLAASEGHVKCCKALLENGAEVDARNSKFWTPLDCAAANGHPKVATILLEFDSPVDPTDKAKTTPLHLAAKEGHSEVVSLLLSKGADITLTDHTGRNCLDLAIDHGRKESAIAIIHDENWMKVMRNKSWDQNRVTTPMRKLITQLPEVAEMVFNQSMKEKGRRAEDPDYEITLDFEFLEDVYLDWSDSADGANWDSSSVTNFSMEDIPEDEEFQRIGGKPTEEEAVTQLEKKHNHPLIIMVEHKREQLLSHPLVTFLLDYKWQKFGRIIYYWKLSIFCLFLIFLTAYTVFWTENRPCNGTESIPSHTVDKTSFQFVLWVDVGRIVILFLASCHIAFEIFQLFYQFNQYFVWENLLEWSVYILAIVYVADEFNVDLVNTCGNEKQTIGALSIFLAWMSLVSYIQKFPKLGIYVVMFTSILYTFLKFFLIYLLFIIAFGLSFYTLLNSQPGFSEPGRSFVKTAVMMIGEFDFDDTFNSGGDVPSAAWFLFIVFVIVMTIILMNLLIGLAVDDIKGVQEQAVLERKAMLVDLAMDVEKALPSRIRKRLLPDKETVRPNKYSGYKRFLYGAAITADDIKTALKPNKTSLERVNDRTEQLMDTVEGLKNRLKTMQFNQEQLHKMLCGVVKHLEAIVEGDDDKDDQLF